MLARTVDARATRDIDLRSGLTVKFVPILGAKRMQGTSIDLVVDEVPLEGAEPLAPADRIHVAGLKTCDYLVHPIAAALSDKFCGLHETHGTRPSSRVKDLVDIAVYAMTCDIDGEDLRTQLQREIAVRKLENVSSFALPVEWGEELKDFMK